MARESIICTHHSMMGNLNVAAVCQLAIRRGLRGWMVTPPLCKSCADGYGQTPNEDTREVLPL